MLIVDELTPIQWADVYHTVFNSAVFFGPAIAIVTSYIRYIIFFHLKLFLSKGKVIIISSHFRIYFCLKSRNETSLVTSMELCRAEEENLNQRKKRSLMKALKMSIIHCVVFIISWTPYTFMATW